MNKFKKAIENRKNKFHLLLKTPMARLSRRLQVRRSIEESTYLGTSHRMSADFFRRKITSRDFLGRTLSTCYVFRAVLRQGSWPEHYELSLSVVCQYGENTPSIPYLEEILTRAIAVKQSEKIRASYR